MFLLKIGGWHEYQVVVTLLLMGWFYAHRWLSRLVSRQHNSRRTILHIHINNIVELHVFWLYQNVFDRIHTAVIEKVFRMMSVTWSYSSVLSLGSPTVHFYRLLAPVDIIVDWTWTLIDWLVAHYYKLWLGFRPWSQRSGEKAYPYKQ